MTHRTGELASVNVQVFFPGETAGSFIERFVDTARDKPVELVATIVWRACERAYRDGMIDAERQRDDEVDNIIDEIRRRLDAGEKQHDIAASYGINQGRISEINTGKRSEL